MNADHSPPADWPHQIPGVTISYSAGRIVFDLSPTSAVPPPQALSPHTECEYNISLLENLNKIFQERIENLQKQLEQALSLYVDMNASNTKLWEHNQIVQARLDHQLLANRLKQIRINTLERRLNARVVPNSANRLSHSMFKVTRTTKSITKIRSAPVASTPAQSSTSIHSIDGEDTFLSCVEDDGLQDDSGNGSDTRTGSGVDLDDNGRLSSQALSSGSKITSLP